MDQSGGGHTVIEMHKWDEAKELIQLKFEGRDEVLCTMLKIFQPRYSQRLMNIPVR